MYPPMYPPPCRPLTGAVMPAWRFSRRCLAESPQRAPRCLLRVGVVSAHPENREITNFPQVPKISGIQFWPPPTPPPPPGGGAKSGNRKGDPGIPLQNSGTVRAGRWLPFFIYSYQNQKWGGSSRGGGSGNRISIVNFFCKTKPGAPPL